MTNNITPSARADVAPPAAVRKRYAKEIRHLRTRVGRDIIRIGYLLTDVKEHYCHHGEWLRWLEREFGWSDRTALNFMRVYEVSLKSENFSDLSLPISSLYLLAAPSTPEAVRQDVIDRVASGEELTHAQVKAAVDEAKAPKSKPHRPSYIPDPPPPIRDELIEQAVELVRQMTAPERVEFIRRVGAV
jgi:hypothetical protein